MRIILLFLISSCLALAGPTPTWEKLENCQFIPHEWNDGDSFHARVGDKEFIFRLYFVDTPETDLRFPDRVAEQAAALGITSEQALALGGKAKQFTATTLGEAPFTAWTCWQNALGSSHLPRWYAFIETKHGWLDRLLVKNGLARVYGKRITTPEGMDSREYIALLNALAPKDDNRRKSGK